VTFARAIRAAHRLALAQRWLWRLLPDKSRKAWIRSRASHNSRWMMAQGYTLADGWWCRNADRFDRIYVDGIET
jgi:hypothetical protein